MKPWLAIAGTLLIVGIGTPVLAASLQEGTIIPLQAEEDISTQTNQEGDVVHFSVRSNVFAEDEKTLVIKEGASATGMVVEKTSPQRSMKPGKVKVEMLYTTSVSGEKIPLKGYVVKEGVRSATENMICPSLICLSTKGKHAFIHPGDPYQAIIAKEVTVEKPPTQDTSGHP